MRMLMAVLISIAMMSVSVVGVAQARPLAPATAQNGVCEAGEVCLFYNSNCRGSLADFNSWIPDFAGYRFISAGAGQGRLVKNDAASARNRLAGWVARIHFNRNYQGVYDDIPPGSSTSCRNLVRTYNENASLSWNPA